MDASSRYAPEIPVPAWDGRSGQVTFAVFRVLQPSSDPYTKYIWKQFDRWDTLAATYLGGDGANWHLLLDMNPEIQDPHMVDPGTVVRVPST